MTMKLNSLSSRSMIVIVNKTQRRQYFMQRDVFLWQRETQSIQSSILELINSDSGYSNTIICTILAGITHIFVGAIFMMVLLYSVKTNFEDLHVLYCTLGYHLFAVEAILSLHYANGWSTLMRKRHRKLAHFFLQAIGVTLAITGTISAYSSDSWSLHKISGIVAVSFACTGFICGLFVIFLRHKRHKLYLIGFHVFCGLSCLTASTVSLVAILFANSSFKERTDELIVFVMICFVVFITIFIGVTSFAKCVSRS